MQFTQEADLVPVEYRETSKRNRIGMMRKSYAEVKKNLSPEMEDACREIEVGFRCIAGHMGYPNNDILRVRGSGNEAYQEFSEKMQDKVRDWRNDVDPKYTGVVIDFVVHGISFKQIAQAKQRSRQTISKYFYEGLREYCDLHFK